MSRRVGQLPLWVWLAALACAWVVTFAGAQARATVSQSPAPPAKKPAAVAKSSTQAPQTPPSTATYVGDAACGTCHEAAKAGYDRSKHHFAAAPRRRTSNGAAVQEHIDLLYACLSEKKLVQAPEDEHAPATITPCITRRVLQPTGASEPGCQWNFGNSGARCLWTKTVPFLSLESDIARCEELWNCEL